jgi:hypothetical protein
MPIPLPNNQKSRGSARQSGPDWIALWALSVGAAAVLVAGLINFAVDDQTGAAWVLFGAAAAIGVVMFSAVLPQAKL